MRAEFRLSADLSVIVDTEAPERRNVRVTVFRGVCFDHRPNDPNCKEMTAEVISVPRNEARAIASAIMGCAAEL